MIQAFLFGVRESPAWSEGVACPDGIPTNLNESCFGRCNYEPQNVDRSPLSTVAACKDTSICVKETTWSVEKLVNGGKFEMRVCNGQFRCEDKGDLDWCKSEERRSERCPLLTGNSLDDCGQKKCNSDSRRCSGLFPGQCFDHNKRTIQKSFFNCLDRSDLNPFVIEDHKQVVDSGKILDFDKIESCERYVNQSQKISALWLNIGISKRQKTKTKLLFQD